MRKIAPILVSLVAFATGNCVAQGFPDRPLTLLCTCPAKTAGEEHLIGLGQIVSKYLGQPVTVKNGGFARYPAMVEAAARASPDGYTLSVLTILAFRLPHLQRTPWHPVTDFTFIIGLARYTVGVVVASNSPFKTIDDLIAYAKANPGKVNYGAFPRAGTPHLAMEELALKSGVRLVPVFSPYADSVTAMNAGQLMAISESSVWAPQVDAGTFRLLVTFGDLRSRWNAPTAKELGLDVVAYSPFGLVGPKGMNPAHTKILHDRFNQALDDPEYDKLLKRLDMVDWYKSSEDYADWAVDQFEFQRKLLERTIGLGKN